MKKIFEQIYKIFDHIIQLHPKSPLTIRKLMKELRKMIEEFEEADLTDREKIAVEKRLEGMTGRRI